MICGGQKINQIRFNHKGLDIAFRCFLEDNDISLDRTMAITFEDMEEDREFLQLFSFICLLSFDVYMKKQLIEKLIDQLP